MLGFRQLVLLPPCVVCMSVQAANSTITFDDIAGVSSIPNGYAGLDWNNFVVHDTLSDPNSGFAHAAVSGDWVAFNSAGYPASISSPNPGGFDLSNGYFTAAWNDGLQVTTVATFLDGSSASKSFVVDTSGPVNVNFNWNGLASVTFSASGGTRHPGFPGQGPFFTVDNLTVNAVPEPGTFAVLALGLGALALRPRQKKASA